MRTCFLLISITVMLCIPSLLFAQQQKDTTARQDTTKAEHIINGIKEGKLSKRIMKSITRKKQSDPVAAVKSEAAFMPYEGKIIRNILIRHIDFQRTVY